MMWMLKELFVWLWILLAGSCVGCVVLTAMQFVIWVIWGRG